MNRIYSEHWNEYELIDAGNNKKLERFGKIITIRPDRNAYFSPILSEKEWKQKAHFEFIEETEDSYIFKLTDLYKDILKRIIRDSTNFRCINPQFQQYSLNPDQLKRVKRIFGKTLINGMYDKKGKDGIYCITDKNENFKEIFENKIFKNNNFNYSYFPKLNCFCSNFIR